MSGSLIERLAAAPVNVRRAIEVTLALGAASPARRDRAVAHLPAGLRQRVLARLPAEPVDPGSDAGRAWSAGVIVEGLGDAHGGADWLRATRGRGWDTDRDERSKR